MESHRAHDLEMELIESTQHGVYVSERSSNGFWSELMLYSNGFSNEDARIAIGAFNERTGIEHDGDRLRSEPSFATLRRVLERHEMPAPPAPERDPEEWHLSTAEARSH